MSVDNDNPMSKSTILVIDDEPDLVELVRYNLVRDGFEVACASDGRAGLQSARYYKPDLVVLDVMMPNIDGLEVCKQLRADSRTSGVPIILLTAKSAEADRIVGLELGADDYVTKPFSPRELVARVKAVLRRSTAPPEKATVLRQGPLSIDLERHDVRYEKEPISLTPTEFRILELIMTRAGRVLSRDDIINGALGRDTSIYDRTIDVHITGLRRKLGKGAWQIQTVRGFGYRLADRADEMISS
jgi:DNA-binding response OmpR family regulator